MKHSKLLNLFASAATIILFVGCSTQLTAPNDSARDSQPVASAKEQKAKLTVNYDAPKDWVKSNTDGMTIFTAPEGNAKLVVVSGISAESVEAAAASAWSQYNEGFSRTIRLNISTPTKQGWDEISIVKYETSPSEERVINAIVYKASSQWRVLLIDGNRGTINKRGAAIGGMFGSFSVLGHVAEDLSDRMAKELTPERVNELLDFVSASAKEHDVPGVGIALIQNGKVVFEGGIGVKAIDSNELIDKNTRFMVASNTKGMTTLLLAKLVELGKLNWDDRVIDHYPPFKLGDKETTESVLIQHLVCACTGLPRKDLDWVYNSGPNEPASVTFSDLAATAPTSGFGELFQYNNQMAAAAGYIAGHVLYPDMEIGAAYDKAMQEYIFDPLEMDQTTFSFEDALRGNYAKPHALNVSAENKIIEQTTDRGFNHTVVPYRPAGGAWSTPHDMIKYIQNELSEGVAADGTRLFAAEPLLKRREPSVAAGENRFYGMGLGTHTLFGIETVNHGGSMAGYKSQILIVPSANIGAVILTNSDSGGWLSEPFVQRLIEILYDAESKAEELVAKSSEFEEIAREELRADLTNPPAAETVSNLAIKYHSDELGALEILKEGSEVILDPGVWSSPIATKENADGTTSLIMTSPEMLGDEVIVGESDGKRTLTIITPQHTYLFTEVVN